MTVNPVSELDATRSVPKAPYSRRFRAHFTVRSASYVVYLTEHDPVFVGFFVFMLACMIVGLLGFAVESRARDEEEIIELAPVEYAPRRAPMPERSIETQAISRAVSNAR
jgi:hypothetical protein